MTLTIGGLALKRTGHLPPLPEGVTAPPPADEAQTTTPETENLRSHLRVDGTCDIGRIAFLCTKLQICKDCAQPKSDEELRSHPIRINIEK